MQHILEPWPWYITGPLISLIMFALIYLGKTFGMSSNLSTLCAMSGVGKKVKFFNFNWRDKTWSLVIVLGTIIGGAIAQFVLSAPTDIALHPETINNLQELGFNNAGKSLLPNELYHWEAIFSLKGMAILVGGGFLVGFGSRYAGGCTSGHAITGLSSLQLPSLISVIGFFIGGLVMIHFLFPLIF